MAKKALDMKDDEVPPEDLEALRWVREKRGMIELGKPYTIQKFSAPLQIPYKEDVPARLVTVEVPTFTYGSSGCAKGRGATLREAVQNTKEALRFTDPEDTYPVRDEGLERVLLKVGSAEFRVADLCALIRDYYDDDHPTGGTLHCALDDGNMLDAQIDAEIQDAKASGDRAALLIAELLRLVPQEARIKLYDRGYGR
jgi:hypothetical protein